MKQIRILGPGCSKCKKLTENTQAAVAALGIEAAIEKVDDLAEMMKLGVMSTPALAVDGELKSSGKLLGVDEIKALLQP